MLKNILAMAKPIQLLIFDVDGVLTDGLLYYSDDGVESKTFHVQDGLGIKLLQSTGVTVAIITSRESNLVTQRAQFLGITHVYQGVANKITAYEALLQKLNVKEKSVAYVGDDLVDLPVMQRVGLSIAVNNARPFVKKQADWITTQSGGQGAAREVCELIMKAQGHLDNLHKQYLTACTTV